ncbi:hypothetical protein AUK40_03460 [Candidatus Wirthbacteria bacterium CG2_30_54_11]|uniref:Glycosyl transferase family 1 n=1 Tax=Candidatus Wirthbacteria bacterium CG2_30_54_11 TaxID=1817892 RepID=A0A1J5ISD5_9BACT|nr:MAG: hypothetical protein AUK40_03460 [Candidatus Wirthbacteria bacterium CG2_30_54_11]
MLIGIDASRANRNNRSGIENYSLQMTLALIRQKSGHRFVLYIREPPVAELQNLPGRVEVKIISNPSWWSSCRRILRFLPQLWTHIALRAELKKAPVDLLFIPGHVVPLGYSGRCIVTIHDLGYEFVPEHYSLFERLYLRFSTSYSARRAGTVITVSDKTRQDLMRFVHLPAERIHVLHPGYAADLFKPRTTRTVHAIQKKYDLSSPYIIFVGNVTTKKGLETLIEGFSLFLFEKQQNQFETRLEKAAGSSKAVETEQEGSDAFETSALDLVIIGSGKEDYKNSLLALADKYRVADRVHFLGFVEDADLCHLLSGAKAYVQPSHYEGFGIPVVEAMASGVPVIVTDAGGLLEVVEDAGQVCKAGDAPDLSRGLHTLLDDETIRQSWIKKGLARVHLFNWDEAAGSLLQLIGD